MKREKAMFAMGCFWGVQSLFDSVKGVLKTEVGYTGGDEDNYPNPCYREVCSDKTGHAEAVYIEFNPEKIRYEKLLDVFWHGHNPTTLNRQGPDFGTQYRSAIFYFNETQRKAALKSKKKRQKELGRKKIMTEIIKAGKFHPAEEYHQKYLEKKGLAGCHI